MCSFGDVPDLVGILEVAGLSSCAQVGGTPISTNSESCGEATVEIGNCARLLKRLQKIYRGSDNNQEGESGGSWGRVKVAV